MPDLFPPEPDAPASPIRPNVERLNKVADMIQAHPEHFDMSNWVVVGEDRHYGSDAAIAGSVDLFGCGTTACIAGWAVCLWPAEVMPDENVPTAAQRILGLDDYTAMALFMAPNASCSTADKAADHLRRMALDAERDQ
jgi:hypothetical protein